MVSQWLTDRLEIRSLQLTDVHELFSLIDDNRNYLRQWLPWLDDTKTPADTHNFIRNAIEQFGDTGAIIAAICYDKQIVGIIGYNHIDWGNAIAHIGYWLAESHQGQGIMTTACRYFVEYSFSSLSLNRLVIRCATRNHRSRAIPERLGFHHEGRAREAEWLYDHFVDHEIYSMLSRDWQH